MRAPFGNVGRVGTWNADILDFRLESSSGHGVDYTNPGGNDRITGTRYDDSFVLSSGTEVINGGAGNDRVSYVNSTGAVQVNLANTTQQGGYAAGDQLTSIEDVIGSAYGDRLSGNNALNRLEGRSGNDILFGGFDGQRDILDGGADTDLVDYSSALRSMTITLGNGATAGSATLHASSFTPIYGAGGQLTGGSAQPPVQEDVLFNIENVVGTNFGDFITGNSESNDLQGLSGNDTIIRTAGGRDIIDGGPDIDTLVIEETDGTGVTVNMGIGSITGVGWVDFEPDDGYAFDDANFVRFFGIENVTGTIYDDSIDGDEADNVIRGRDGNDSLDGFGGIDRLFGGAGNDTITGGDGGDFLFGDNNDDRLVGERGGDQLDGGEGRDTALYVNSLEGVRIDLLNYTASGGDAQGDTLTRIENLTGSYLFDDVLSGDREANVLDGLGGKDDLDGREGDDTLIGGNGNDTLTGGADKDSFVFDFAGPSESASAPEIGDDVIKDWQSGIDQLVFTNRQPDMVMEVDQVGEDTVLTFVGVQGSITILNAQANEFLLI